MPVICVGNISVGGTGKSPMVEYLVSILKNDYKLGTISRGYKRKTKGYLLAGEQTTALDIGDEPMQFHRRFPELAVAVGEERILAVPQLLQDKPETQVIILDDAFQHREIKAGLNIILTDYSNPYWFDWYLPTGDLRDNKRSMHRAEVIVVTKCPPDITREKRASYLKHIKPSINQKVFFTMIEYGDPYHIATGEKKKLDHDMELLLVCGIANPAPLKEYIEKNTAAYFEKNYNDHHIFTIDDWNDIEARFSELEGENNIILTTEKDAVRLLKFSDILADKPVYVLPISVQVLFNEGKLFHSLVNGFIESFSSNAQLTIENA